MSNIVTYRISINGNGYASPLYLTANSGKIIYRDKVDTIIGIKHPGIVLGDDAWGRTWVIHNHYEIGYTAIVTFEEFSMGCRVFYDERNVFYNAYEIIDRAITHWYQRKEYHWLFNNCQHFVNEVTQNDNYSETIDKVSNNTMIAGGLISFFGLMTNNKATIQTGLSIAGVGATGKVLNRIK